ncbi:MAG: VOC family protein [Thermoplasmata archaeon]|nr:VOC family protein [Thermoplasmata archaeon]
MRFLHTSITVRNMEESIAYYTGVLGLEFERRRRIPENHAEIAFVKDTLSGARVELTHWDGKDTFDAGEQLDHLAFEVEDMEKFLAEARGKGAKVAKEPYTLTGGSSRIAFILDPNDVWIEIIEHPTAPR